MTTKGNSNKPRVNMPRPSFMWVYGILGALIIGWALFGQSDDTPLPSDWSTVGQMVEAGEVEKIEIFNRDQARVYLTKEAVEKYRTDPGDKRFHRMPARGVQLVFTIGSVDSFREDLKDAEQQSGQQVPVVYENKTNDWTNILVNLLPWVLIIGVWIFLMRSMARGAGGGAGGGIMNVGKAKAQVFDKDNSKRVTFKDVAGLEEAKVEIMEIVDFLRKADKYRELGAKIPKGALLVGPPGTGKTLLAKAVAGEANVPFLSISGSDFVEMFVGVGASRVRDLFEQAKQKAETALSRYAQGETFDTIGEDMEGSYAHIGYAENGASDMLTWAFDDARQEGDTTVAANGESGYYAVLFHSRSRNDYHTVSVRHILVDSEEKANELLQQYNDGEKTEDAFATAACTPTSTRVKWSPLSRTGASIPRARAATRASSSPATAIT